MGVYYPGNGTTRYYDEPGKPDRTNKVAELRQQAAKLIEGAKLNDQSGYKGHAACNRSEAQRLRDEAQRMEDN